jgi:hypothetical protein
VLNFSKPTFYVIVYLQASERQNGRMLSFDQKTLLKKILYIDETLVRIKQIADMQNPKINPQS